VGFDVFVALCQGLMAAAGNGEVRGQWPGPAGRSSAFKGVSWSEGSAKWRAQCWDGSKVHSLLVFGFKLCLHDKMRDTSPVGFAPLFSPTCIALMKMPVSFARGCCLDVEAGDSLV
jgi:hypothetical protein